jgi:hypothetical protein
VRKTDASLRQHGASRFICVSVFALVERKNRNAKEELVCHFLPLRGQKMTHNKDKVPRCRRLERCEQKS